MNTFQTFHFPQCEITSISISKYNPASTKINVAKLFAKATTLSSMSFHDDDIRNIKGQYYYIFCNVSFSIKVFLYFNRTKNVNANILFTIAYIVKRISVKMLEIVKQSSVEQNNT